MVNFYKHFELQKVLSYLESAKYIEQQLRAKYIEPDFQRVEYRKYKKRRPLLLQLVAKLVKDIQAEAQADGWESTIGILLFENHRLDGWRNSLYYSDIQSEIIRDQNGSVLTPGVKLLTMHGAKGHLII